MLSALLPLALFMFVASITPGPNNIMLAAAGASAGFRATVPHMLGISIGHAFQIVLMATGIGALVAASDGLGVALRIVSAAYLLWLALKLVRAAPPRAGEDNVAGRPLGFLGAAAFQWVNPKAWMMALTVAGAMLPAGFSFPVAVVLVALISMLVNLPCVACWAALGAGIRRWLTEPWRWRQFNAVMAVMLVLTAWWVVLG